MRVGTSLLAGAALGPSIVSAQLDELAKAAGLLYFGTAVSEGQVNSDSAYRAIVNNKAEIGQLVPENSQKWDSTEPNRGSFQYGGADLIPGIATANGQVLRCHALVWHNQLPRWVTSRSWSRTELQSVIETHISNVAGHFRGKCYAWDVVNEVVDDNGNWRDSVFYRTLNTDFLAISFRAAKAADPTTKLYLNDYNLEYNNAKTSKTVDAVKIIQAAGAPIDGVGFQGHLIVGSTPSRANLAAVLRRFTSLGVEVAYTEVDIRHSSLPASGAALATQGNDYVSVVGSCLDVDGCVGVTVWGFTDKYSWVPGTFPGTGDALLYDSSFRKKPAWTSVSSVLAAANTGGPPVTSPPGPTPTTTPTMTSTSTRPTQTGGAKQWEQCGGLNWSGPTTCVSPFTCTKLNDWYWQCL